MWLSEVNHTSAIAARCDVLGVHLLRADQHALAQRLGAVTAAVDRRKLDGVALRHHPSGAILLDDCTTWFVGRVLEPVVGGDHTGALLDPVDVSVGAAPAPLRLSTIDFSAGHPVE